MSIGDWRLRLAPALIGAWLGGCCGGPGKPECVRPTVTVASAPGLLSISGSGFSDVPKCAHLTLIGLPASTGSVAIGDPQCAGGAFQGFNWQYSYFNCSPSTTQTVFVLGADAETVVVASREISIPWGAACGLSGYTKCGGEGQIPCATGCNPATAATPAFHPSPTDGQILCSKN